MLKHIVISLAIIIPARGSGQELAQREPWHLKTGPNYTRSVVTLPNVHGYEVSGHGAGRLPSNPSQLGTTSYLIRRGNDSSAMIEVPGNSAYLHDFSLQGVMTGDDKATRPAAGIHLKFARGTGTGGLVAERLTFENLAVAWKIGETNVVHKCDTSVLRDSTVYNCDTVIEQNNGQAISNRVEGVFADTAKCFCRVHGGGNLAIRDCAVIRVPVGSICPLLHLGGGKTIGSNTWTFSVDNFKFDAQCEDRGEIVRMDGPKYANIRLVAIHVAHDGYGEGKYLWNLQDGVRITIDGSENVLQRHSVFVKDHPKFPPPIIDARSVGQCCDPRELLAPGSGPLVLILKNAFVPLPGGSRRWIDEFEATLGQEK